jgi:hypothetical protein
MKRLGLLGLLVVLATAGESCADLPTLTANTCGNGVIDPGEDCDSFPSAGCHPAGAAQQCHYKCTSCPSGWGCDAKLDICREPIGSFGAAVSSFETPSERLEVADFDADGKKDLVAHSSRDATGSETLRVFFFEGNNVATSLPLSASVLSPVILDIDLDKEKHSDLMFATGGAGINVMLGRSDRTLGPVAFPRFPFAPGSAARFVRVDGINLPLPVSFLNALPAVFAQLEPPNYQIAIATSAGDPSENVISALDRKPDAILDGSLIATNINESSTCDELVWVYAGESIIRSVDVCFPGSGLPKADPMGGNHVKALITADERIGAGPIPADVNNDGHIDLLFQGEEKWYVAFGKGDGTFSGSPDLTATKTTGTLSCDVVNPGAIKDMLIAFGGCRNLLAGYPTRAKFRATDKPLLAVGAISLKFPFGAITRVDKVTSPITAPTDVTLRLVPVAIGTREWSIARFDDFNANNYVDAVAASHNTSDIDFFNGTGGDTFNPGRLRTDAPISHLTAADFDGDLVNDLGFVEKGAGGGNLDAVGVAYGNFAGPPATPLRLGLFPNIIQAQSAKAAGFDNTFEFGVMYKGEASTDLIAILQGNGDRQLLSPFSLSAPVGSKFLQADPVLLSAGDFDGDGVIDAVALAIDITERTELGALRPWFVKGRGEGRFNTPAVGEPITAFTVTQGGQSIAVARGADLNGDKTDEAVVLAPAGDENGKPPTLITYAMKSKAPAASAPVPIPLGAEAGLLIRLQLELADVDGDGKIDAVIGAYGRSKSFVIIAWGNGDGTFDVAGKTVVETGATAPPRDFALTQLDTDPARELLIANEEGTYAIQVDGRVVKATKILPPAAAVVAGDLNGDGLPDIAISRSHRVTIFPGVSR